MQETLDEGDILYLNQDRLRINARIVDNTLVVELVLNGKHSWDDDVVIDDTRIHLSNLKEIK